jgi:hypothetical protein
VSKTGTRASQVWRVCQKKVLARVEFGEYDENRVLAKSEFGKCYANLANFAKLESLANLASVD